MSVLEAATLGTPALAVDASGIRDAVVDGVTGVLVRAADESGLPEALAKGYVDFINDNERRRTMGASPRQRSFEFGWDRCVDRWETVLIGLISSDSSQVRR